MKYKQKKPKKVNFNMHLTTIKYEIDITDFRKLMYIKGNKIDKYLNSNASEDKVTYNVFTTVLKDYCYLIEWNSELEFKRIKSFNIKKIQNEDRIIVTYNGKRLTSIFFKNFPDYTLNLDTILQEKINKGEIEFDKSFD